MVEILLLAAELPVAATIRAISIPVLSAVSQLLHTQADIDVSSIMMPVANLVRLAVLLPGALSLLVLLQHQVVVLIGVADILKTGIFPFQTTAITVIDANFEKMVLNLIPGF